MTSSALKKFIQDESGQAIMEYVLLLLAIVSIVGVMKTGLKQITTTLWLMFAKKIAAPCPTCNPGPDISF